MTQLPEIESLSPRITRSGTLHENPFGSIYAARAEFDGFSKDYYVADFGPRVGVIALRDGKVLLTAQYRLLIDRIAWEIPGGRIDPGESQEEAAQRECLEETGYYCSGLRRLVSYRPGLDNVDNLTTVFYSENVVQRQRFSPNPSEVIAVAWLPLKECVELVLENKIVDCLTISAVLAYECLKRTAK
jgi:8-oxo-dGTP pyrophosphatase MutT (NUDIX family)